MINEDIVIHTDSLIIPISNGTQGMRLVVMYLNEHVIDVAISSPKQFEPIWVVGKQIEAYAHAHLNQFVFIEKIFLKTVFSYLS